MSKVTNQLNNIIRTAGWAKAFADMDDVMKRIQEQKPQQVCCTGSLYLCGDLLNDLE